MMTRTLSCSMRCMAIHLSTCSVVATAARCVGVLLLSAVPLSAQGIVTLGLGASESWRKSVFADVPGTTRGGAFDLNAALTAPVRGPWVIEIRGNWRTRRTLIAGTGESLDAERLEGELVLGRELVRLRVGTGRRSLSGALGQLGLGVRQWSYQRAGGELTVPLRIPRLSMSLAAAYYFGVEAHDDKSGGRGREAELRLVMPLPPFHIFAAYRYDEFSSEVSPVLGGTRTERTANVLVGVSLSFLGGGGSDSD